MITNVKVMDPEPSDLLTAAVVVEKVSLNAVSTCGSGGTVGADHLFGSGDHSAGGSGRTRTLLAVSRRPPSGVAVETVLTALAAQPDCVVLTVTRSWTTNSQLVSSKQIRPVIKPVSKPVQPVSADLCWGCRTRCGCDSCRVHRS